MRRDPRLVVVLVLSLFLAAGAWLAVSSSGGGAGGSARGTEGQAGGGRWAWQKQLVRLAARESASRPREWPYSGLPEPRPMPRSLRRRAVENMGGRQIFGLRFDRARFAPTAIGGGLWVVRGNGITCIFQAVKAASSCAIDSIALEGLQLVVGREKSRTRRDLPKAFLAFGIEPDGVAGVWLRSADAPARKVPVSGNAFGALAKSPVRVEGVVR